MDRSRLCRGLEGPGDDLSGLTGWSKNRPVQALSIDVRLIELSILSVLPPHFYQERFVGLPGQ